MKLNLSDPEISAIYGEPDENTLAQIREVKKNAVAVALMADAHLGYVMPIGGVAAYEDKVSVTGVGYDIGCGNLAAKTDINLNATSIYTWEPVANELAARLDFGVGKKNSTGVLCADKYPYLFDDSAWDYVPKQFRNALRDKAYDQLGTIGGGNHYVDLFVDDDGFVWIGAHFGSRGFGHSVASGFMAEAAGEAWNARVPEVEVLLDMHNERAWNYLSLMRLARQYAEAGREWVVGYVADTLGTNIIEVVHNNHNYAWIEEYDLGEGPRDYIVVRKGATPAKPGQFGFIGGSMGDDAVIVKGTACAPTSATAMRQHRSLYSTVHGAGRVMSRSMAKGNRKQTRKGLITRQMMSDWTKDKGVIVRGGDVDEAPQAYRRLADVLDAQGDTIEIMHTLHPLVVIMADARVPKDD